MELYREAGEWVNAGDKVLRIVQMDRLRVEGLLDTARYNPHEVEGRLVTVTVTMARGEKVEFKGYIVFVGLEKRAGNRVTVRAEVENRTANNRWLLMPGTDVAMRIHLGSPVISQQPKDAAGAAKLTNELR